MLSTIAVSHERRDTLSLDYQYVDRYMKGGLLPAWNTNMLTGS